MLIISVPNLRVNHYLNQYRHILYAGLSALLIVVATLSSAYAQTGAALNFDGVDDYVSISNTFPRLTTFTIEAWINPGTGYGTYTDSGEPVEIISRWGGGGPNNATFRFGISPSGKLTGAVFADGLGSTVVTSSATIQTNTWTHIAFTRSADNTLRLYINGVLDGSTANSVTPQSSTYMLNFGRPIAGNNKYKGSLDEVRIWNRELIACELTNRRNCEVSGPLANLVAAYNFNQGTAGSNNSGVNSLTDASGNNYNGTLNSFALNNATSNWLTPGGITSGNTCPAFTLTANPSLTIANGNSTTLTASGANSYVWSTNATTSTINANPTTTTTYSVTGTTANGCAIASTTVTVPSALTVAITASATNVCPGSTVSLTGIVTGGTTPYSSYTWVAPAGVTINGSGSAVTAATSTTLSGPQAITLKVSDALNAPVASRTLVINITSSLTVTITGNLNITSGASTTLTASGANSYTWSTGQNTTAITVNSLTATTMFSVTGSTNDCVGSATATVTVSEASALPLGCNTYQTITTANGLGSNTVNKVVAVGNNVYVATDNGLSISTDGGKTFTNRTTANGLGSNLLYALQVVGNTIYVGNQSGLAISTDGGQTFTNRNLGRVTAVFAVDNTVYVGLSPNKFFKSTDGGQTFDGGLQINTNVANGSSTITDIYATGNTVYLSTAKGFFVSTDAGGSFSFKNVGTLNQPSLAVQEGTIYVGTTGGIGISTDGGQSFVKRTTSNGLASNGVRGLYAVGSRVYAATDGGLSISTDGGQTFTSHTIDANGLAAAGIVAVAVQGERVYAGTSAGLSIPGSRMRTVLSGTSTTLVSPTITVAPGSSAMVFGPEPNDTYNWITGSTEKSIQVNTTGIYSLTTTGACPGSSSVSITVLQPTSGATLATLTPGQCPATLSFDQSGQRIEVTGPGGYSFKNALAKLAVAGKRYPVSLTGIRNSGIYTVKTFDSAGTLLSVVEYSVLGGCN